MVAEFDVFYKDVRTKIENLTKKYRYFICVQQYIENPFLFIIPCIRKKNGAKRSFRLAALRVAPLFPRRVWHPQHGAEHIGEREYVPRLIFVV